MSYVAGVTEKCRVAVHIVTNLTARAASVLRACDRLVVEPLERSEKAAELFPWVGLAWNLGVFNPIVGLLTPDFAFSGMGWGCW